MLRKLAAIAVAAIMVPGASLLMAATTANASVKSTIAKPVHAADTLTCYDAYMKDLYNPNYVTVNVPGDDYFLGGGISGVGIDDKYSLCYDSTTGYYGLKAFRSYEWVGVNDTLNDELTATAGGLGNSESFTYSCDLNNPGYYYILWKVTDQWTGENFFYNQPLFGDIGSITSIYADEYEFINANTGNPLISC